MVTKKDMKILELLQKDSRMPITEIAESVDMSENGVRYRLSKMEEEGILRQFTILLNPEKLGKKVMAIFDIDVEPNEILNSIQKMNQMEEIIKIYQTTGQFSILAIGLFDDNEQMNIFMNNTFLKELPVKNYAANIVTKKYKDSIYQI